MRHRRSVGRMQLAHIVAAAAQAVDVGIRQIGDQRGQLRRLREKALAVVGAIVRRQGLELAVDGVRERAQQFARGIPSEQKVPIGTPQHLDHMPAGAGEQGFEFIDDAAVAAHRPVEPLQIAVDDEAQMVEAFARGQRQRADRFRLVHLAVAEEAPDPPLAALAQAAVMQIAQKPRLVDRVDRPQPHRAGRKLPEIGHQPRMRVRAQTVATDFASIVIELLLAQMTFEKGTRIHARRRMRLEEHQIAAAGLRRPFEEVLKADFEQIRRRRVGGDMAALLKAVAIGAHHHHQRVPADRRGQLCLQSLIPRIVRLPRQRDRVAVGRHPRPR